MPRRLAILNVLLVLVAAGAVAFIVRDVTTPPRPMPLRPRATVPDAAPPRAAADAPATPGSYVVVASRNLFSPSRSEAPATGTVGGRPAAAVPKPTLHGVVIREGAPIAYLEDPSTKRVAGYRLGDSVGGGTVQTINADRVVLTRPEGAVDLRLRDPSKPRPPAPPGVAPTIPGGRPALPGMPGVQEPVTPAPGVTGGPAQPQMPVPPRRLLPPNVLRRLPPATDATR